MQEQIGKVTLNLDSYQGVDLYSDGDIEDRMLEMAREQSEEQIRRDLVDNDQWPIFYHFSPMREQILSWYPFEKDSSILEVGAGCGAISGCLCRLGGEVTAVELSKKRSSINAWRHRDCDNLTIMLGNFCDVAEKLDRKYDYITLIGVFEYAASYIPSAKPFDDFLEKLNALLKPNGKLLIAIENRLGLKYFAGCKEDHLGQLFSGVEGYSVGDSVRTFSRDEWCELLDKNGFTEYEFRYPYPDYKLPLSIYSDDYLPRPGELTKNIVNCDQDRMIFFDESRTFDSLSPKQFPVFSNSFLIEISKRQVKK